MKIKEFKINNVQGIKSITYKPKNTVCALFGANGKGKSTFQRALVAALTGKIPDNFIREGEDEATISLTLEDVTGTKTVFTRTYKRGKPCKCQVDGKNVTSTVYFQTMEDVTGLGKDGIAVTSAHEITDSMKPDELMSILLAKIPDTITGKDFAELLSNLVDGWNDDYAEYVNVFLPNDLTKEFGSSEKVGKIYESVFTDRTYKTKTLGSLKMQLDPHCEERPVRSASEISVELDKLKSAKAAESSAKEALRLYESAERTRKAQLEKIAELKETYNSFDAEKPTEAEKDRLIDSKKEYQERLAFDLKLLAGTESNIARLSAGLDNLSKPVCPLSNSIICTTDKTEAKEELERGIAENKETKSEIERDIEEIKRKAEKTESMLADYAEREMKYQQKVSLARQIAILEKSVPDLPRKPDIVETDENLDSEIQELTSELAYAEAYEKNVRIGKEIEGLEEHISMLQHLVSALAPKGPVLTAIQDKYLSIVEEAVNERAKLLPRNIKAHFVADGGVRYYLSIEESEPRPYECLSHGEQTIAVFLLLDLFNSLYGTRIMVLDDLNHLDSLRFEEIIDLVLFPDVLASYDHIFLAATYNSDFDTKLAKSVSGGKIDVAF